MIQASQNIYSIHTVGWALGCPAGWCHSVMFVCPVTGPLALAHSEMFGQNPVQQAGRAVGRGRGLGVLLQSQEGSLLPSSTPRGLLPASAGPHKEETTSTKALFIPADPDSSTLRKKEGERGLCIGSCHYLRQWGHVPNLIRPKIPQWGLIFTNMAKQIRQNVHECLHLYIWTLLF